MTRHKGGWPRRRNDLSQADADSIKATLTPWQKPKRCARHLRGPVLPENTKSPENILEIFYFDAGGGHRNAMTALSRLIAQRHPEWTVVPVDLQNLLEPIDPVHKLTRYLTGSLNRLLPPIAEKLAFAPMQAQDIYNNALKRGATYGMGAFLPVLQGFVRRYAGDIRKILEARWNDADTRRPDLVVSVIPNFNAVMHPALKAFDPSIPYVTVMTDMVDCPPHFWMEDQRQYIVCGTPRAAQQARSCGFYTADSIFEVSGMILRDSFYTDPVSSCVSRQALGLMPDRPTALIMFGGNGSLRASLAIVGRLEKQGLGIQTIVMCGNNHKLLERLQGRRGCHPVGFVPNVVDYMRLADFFIGKPGPGSVSEAIHMNCPVIVEANAATMPQERPNVDWIAENGVGIVVANFRKEIAGAAARMLRDLPRYKANIAQNIPKNRAVFEIVDIFGKILDGTSDYAAARHAGLETAHPPNPLP